VIKEREGGFEECAWKKWHSSLNWKQTVLLVKIWIQITWSTLRLHPMIHSDSSG
jgi:hypothetical protein